MQVSIFGLGHVGCILAGCLADCGHQVTGVDVNPQKVQTVNDARSPIEEPQVDDLIEAGVANGRIEATTDSAEAVAKSSLSFVTVGTRLDDTGQLSTTNLYNVMDSIADPIDEKSTHTVVVRSTVPPGTTRNLRSYLDDKLGADSTANFVFNPEFLREGTALEDFYDPPYVVLGTFEDDNSQAVRDVYTSLDVYADVESVPPERAETLKMVNNAFHALKISFANEVGSIASAVDVDGKELLGLVCADEKLNISSEYLEPGFAFGGSCLPKDTRAIANISEAGDDSPVLESIIESNDRHLDRIAERVGELDGSTVGIVGLSFKSDTMDMRNSPGLRLATRLDKDVRLYGKDLDLTGLVGSNRDYLDRTQIDVRSHVVEDPDEFLQSVDIVVFANCGPFEEIESKLGSKVVCDPVGAVRAWEDEIAEYNTVAW